MTTRPPLLRAKRGSEVRPQPVGAGVCSGVAYHLGIPVWIPRAIVVAATPLLAAGPVIYGWLWATVPEEGSPAAIAELTEAQAHSRKQPIAGSLPTAELQLPSTNRQLMLIGLGSLGLALLLAVAPGLTGLNWTTFVWWLLLAAGIVLVWAQAPRLFGPRRATAAGFTALGTTLTVLALALLFQSYSVVGSIGIWATIVLVATAGILIALAPLGVKTFGELTAARTREAREAERADIAAHLHDSVLQTLTLIRAGADSPTRVRALALRQERELRAWLYTGSSEPEESVADAVRGQALEVETAYGVEIELVTVGDRVPSPADLAAVAAAREAMTNAARHGKAPISVYQEVRAESLEIFVKDSGDGFDPDQIPEDRHGYRHSIVGRVERVGGNVKVRQRAGTEIAIWVPHERTK